MRHLEVKGVSPFNVFINSCVLIPCWKLGLGEQKIVKSLNNSLKKQTLLEWEMQKSIPIPCTAHRGLAQSRKLNPYYCPKTTCALLVFGDAIIILSTSVLSRITAQLRNWGWFGCHLARFPTWNSKPRGCLCVCVLEVLGTKMQQVKTIHEIVTLQSLQTFRALHCCRLGCCLLKKKWK